MLQKIQDIAFQAAVRGKVIVYRAFLVVYAGILITLIAGSMAIAYAASISPLFYEIGVWAGRIAVSVLVVVLLPGILGRFGIQIKVTRVITFYRRQLGITTFLLAFTHGMLVRVIFRLSQGEFPFSVEPLFELFGTLALSLMFFLFVTSNDVSVRFLGRWWKRLHRLVYVIVWLILLHTLLQRVSVWSVMIGIVAIAEMISFLYTWAKKGKSV